jgi:hypothetical protein
LLPLAPATSSSVYASTVVVIPWVTVFRYLGIYIVSGNVVKCDFSNVKKSLFKSVNGVFGKIGHRGSADVIVHLFKTKCLPSFVYAMEACPVNTTETKSLDFASFRIYANTFETFLREIIAECQHAFNLSPTSNLMNSRKLNLLRRFVSPENQLCITFTNSANRELSKLKQLPWQMFS